MAGLPVGLVVEFWGWWWDNRDVGDVGERTGASQGGKIAPLNYAFNDRAGEDGIYWC